jgi:hypothetical protein
MAVLKSVQQNGTATIAAGSTSTTAAIPVSVVIAKTFLVFSVACDTGSTNTGGRGSCSGYISATNQLTFTRYASGSDTAVSINWFLVEYTSGVTVQQGSASNTGLATAVTVTSVTLAKAWAEAYTHGENSWDYGGCQMIRADLTAATTLTLRSSVATNANTVRWQVIEHDTASVQKKTGTLVDGTATTDVTVTSVTMASTFVRGNSSPFSGFGSPEFSPRWFLQSATNLRFVRNNPYEDAYYCTYVISGTGAMVQRNSANLTILAATTSKTQAITAVTVARSLTWQNGPNSHYGSAAGGPTNTGQLLVATLDSSTQISVSRPATSSLDVNVFWEVVELPAGARRKSFLPFMQIFAGL